jgi:hypothetical protein
LYIPNRSRFDETANDSSRKLFWFLVHVDAQISCAALLAGGCSVLAFFD